MWDDGGHPNQSRRSGAIKSTPSCDNAAGPAVGAPQMPASPSFPMTSLTAETANQDKPRALPDAEFDSPTAGEGAKTIPPLAKEDGAENRVFPG